MHIFRSFTLITTLLLAWSTNSIADTTNDFKQSQKCSGALAIMTSLGLENETSTEYRYFADLANFHSYLFEYYNSQSTNNSTKGDITQAVSEGVIIVDEDAKRNPNSLQARVKHCISWLAEVKLHFSTQDASTPASKVMGAMPRPSSDYKYPFSDWSPMIPITKEAYELYGTANLRAFHRCIAKGQKQTIECYSQVKS